VGKKVVKGVAFIDSANYHTSALVSIVHMILIETLAEFLLELLFEPLNLAFERCYAFL
jgi:hypothetical protein